MVRLIIGVVCALAIAGCSAQGAVNSTSPVFEVAGLIYQDKARRCVANDLVACGWLTKARCEATCDLCSVEFPQLNSQAREKLSVACRAGDQAGCRGIDAIACDSGDQAACGRLKDQYLKLADSCHAGDKQQCEKIASSPWPLRMLPDTDKRCNGGDAAACEQMKGLVTLNVIRVGERVEACGPLACGTGSMPP